MSREITGVDANGSSTDHGYPIQPLGTIAIGSSDTQSGPVLSSQAPVPLFKAKLAGAVIARMGGQGLNVWEPIHGLQLAIQRNDSDSPAALPAVKLRLKVLDSQKGAETSRVFTLGPQGAFLQVAGWEGAECYVLEAPAGVTVGYAWQSRPPRPASKLILVEAIAAGVARPVPNGAVDVALSDADSAWLWRSNTGSGDLDMDGPQPGGGTQLPVLGASFLPSVANVACWSLESP